MAKQIRFEAGTTNDLMKEFLERAKYKKLVTFEGMIDVWYEDTFYGRINKDYEPVILVPVGDSSILKSFPTVADDVKVVGFVAEAFQNFRRDYMKRVENTNITYPVFLEGLAPKAGHLDFESYYSDYLEFLASSYIERLQSSPSIIDFRTFVIAMLDALIPGLKELPITKSGFLLSKHNDIKTTGLVLELSNLPWDEDLQKGQIIQDSNFSCYLSYANAAGFHVDKNAPWRLLINLDKEVTRLLMRAEETQEVDTPEGKREGLPEGPHSDKSAADVMDSIYRIKTHEDDLFHLQDFMYNIYNKIKKNLAFVSNTGYNDNEELIRRRDISALTEQDWLSLLLKIRLHELAKFDQFFYKEQAQKVIDTISIYGLKYAISKVGQICSQFIKEICETQKEFAANVAATSGQERREDAQDNTDTRHRTRVPRNIY
jgi:hypothetical protein